MLAKVYFEGLQKFVKVPENDGTFDYLEFLQGNLDLEIVADDLSSSVVTDGSPPPIVRTLSSGSSSSGSTVILPSTIQRKRGPTELMDRNEAKEMVDSILKTNQKGEEIYREYHKTKTLTDVQRKQMVNILVADMIESHGRIPPSNVRVNYALGIVSLFPYLQDPFSENGYEHYYEPNGNTGYLAWRIKTTQRNTPNRSSRHSTTVHQNSPTAPRESLETGEQLFGVECKEAISTMRHSTDESIVKDRMRVTFCYRQKMVHDEDVAASVLDVFPRFLDVAGLIDQDFSMMFGDEVSGRFLAKWPTYFQPKVIAECKTLSPNSHVAELMSALEPQPEEVLCGWDADMSAILLLLHLLPPTSRGQNKTGKISSAQATKHLVTYVKEGKSISTFLAARRDAMGAHARQPVLFCVGQQRNQIQRFYIAFDHKAIPCSALTSVAAVDELFKAHYVFSLNYDQALCGFYTFLQTTVYNIDVKSAKETPRVKELRARLLQRDN